MSMGKRIETTAVQGAPGEDSSYARAAYGTNQGTGKKQCSS